MNVDVFNPSTGELITQLPADDKAAAWAKLERAEQFFNQSSQHLALHQRLELLEKLIVLLLERKQEILTTMVQEGGKPWMDSDVEFERAIQGIKLAIETVSVDMGTVIPLGYQASSANRTATTRVFPRGVVLAFSAFNHPLNLIIHQIIPAFATGCPCVVKPAADTPLSCVNLVQAMHDAGIPEDYIQTVITNDNAVAGELAASDKIAFFSFIGSARVGWMLRSKLHPGVRCALEHGGIAPSIVSQHADIERAVTAITKGGFYHAGQVCVSTQRVYVDNTILDDFVTQFSVRANALKVGDASDQTTEVGPLIRTAEVGRIHAWVTEAIQQGAECVLGGEAKGDAFYQPTILLNPPADTKVSTQEILGRLSAYTATMTLKQHWHCAITKRLPFRHLFLHKTLMKFSALTM